MLDWPWYVHLAIGLSLWGLAVIVWMVGFWRTRDERQAARDHDLATQADRYSDRQKDRRKADELRAFLASPEGQFFRYMPVAIKESVRIQPIKDRPADPLATGQLHSPA